MINNQLWMNLKYVSGIMVKNKSMNQALIICKWYVFIITKYIFEMQIKFWLELAWSMNIYRSLCFDSI